MLEPEQLGIRNGYRYDDGSGTDAPPVLFADAGSDEYHTRVHADIKYADEPAIVYVRLDTLCRANKTIRWLRQEIARLRVNSER